MSNEKVINDDANHDEALKLVELQMQWFLYRFGLGRSQQNRVTVSTEQSVLINLQVGNLVDCCLRSSHAALYIHLN
jgi:hypothetical protein